jgi:hypothetical protein
MIREIKIGSISWINEQPSPIWFSGKAAMLDPDWVPKTYMGLRATANSPPPDSIGDFIAYQGEKDFRALMYCHLRVTVDEAAKRVTNVEVLKAVHDPGWTPAFKVRRFPAAGLRFWDMDIWSFKEHAGEASPISVVRTQARHPNSTLTSIGAAETVLVNGVIKFRAGANTDRVGVQSVKCPYHVPWVWCEMALTYTPAGQFKLYGRGSIFPTHCWYLDGVKVKTKDQVGDSSFPTASIVLGAGGPGPYLEIPQPLTINVPALKLYPVLSKGAPASSPQPPAADDAGRAGAVDTHPYTVAGGEAVTSP